MEWKVVKEKRFIFRARKVSQIKRVTNEEFYLNDPHTNHSIRNAPSILSHDSVAATH